MTSILFVDETGSTNADLLALAARMVAEGTWLRAGRQVAGRGRQGRAWSSPAGNLYASTLVRLRPGDSAASSLSLTAGIAVQEAVAVHLPSDAARPMLKWPNDLLFDGAKLAGILLERAGDAVVVGIGANVANHPDLPDRRTACLSALGSGVDAAGLLETIAERFSYWLGEWRGRGMGAIRDRWLALAHPVGSVLHAHDRDGSRIEGLFEGLSGDGALLLRMADGRVRTVHAGDVSLG